MLSVTMGKLNLLQIQLFCSSVRCLLKVGLLNQNTNKFVMASSKSTNNISAPNKADNIVWIDMEMTGLDPEKHHLLEVACLITDGQLNIIAEGPDIAIHQPQEILTAMNEWSTKQHEESGLTQRCRTSTISVRDAERKLVDFVKEWAPWQQCPLGGNTVYMDRLFLKKYMPEFEQHMHYRIIDVSSIKELCLRWYPEIYACQPNKKELSKHLAMSDIQASIEELKFYKNNIFIKKESDLNVHS